MEFQLKPLHLKEDLFSLQKFDSSVLRPSCLTAEQ